jgi:hypothetical protein
MTNLRYVRVAVLVVMLASFAFPTGVTLTKSAIPIQNDAATVSEPTDPPVSNSTFYTLRPDLRRCAAPRCGGYFIKRVNQAFTRCVEGRNLPECYVASIDWKGATEVPANRALVRGSMLKRPTKQGSFGVLRVDEVWQAVTDNKPLGEFYRVRDLGLRCIAAPCLSHQEAKLNTAISRKIAGLDIALVGASETAISEATKTMTSVEGMLVAGSHTTVSGPAGRAQMLNATQFYLQVNLPISDSKPCLKTGCSGEICADETMMSACVYRPEYECYQKARCERQNDGKCGFTKTPELTSCLRRK